MMVAYEFYEASRNMYNLPKQEWKDDLQAFIDDQFDNAPNVYTIGEELISGTQNWSDTDVIITHVIQPGTGKNLGDDWRNIIFSDLEHAKGLGYRYYFDDNVWITVNSDKYKYVTASSIIRRCNCTLKWYNSSNELIVEPSIIDYYDFTAKYNVQEDHYVRLGSTSRFVIMQNNSNTNNIPRDQRFIIDRIAYRVVNFDSITRSGLYLLTVEEHQINEYVDDVENSVVDKTSYGEAGELW